jgi:hypothetical protein
MKSAKKRVKFHTIKLFILKVSYGTRPNGVHAGQARIYFNHPLGRIYFTCSFHIFEFEMKININSIL